MRCLALFTGGLDSQIAVRLLQRQGIEVVGVHVQTPFTGSPAPVEQAAARLQIVLRRMEWTTDYLSLLSRPLFGFAQALAPCLDCRIGMVQRVRKLLEPLGASFLISGEVIGQRPSSLRSRDLETIAVRGDVDDLLLRPLSALLLPPTLPERNGWVDRSQLFGWHGRGRREQLQLARDWDLPEAVGHAPGCALLEPTYASRLQRVLLQNPAPPGWQLETLKFGRHFWCEAQAHLILSKNSAEGTELTRLFHVANEAGAALLVPHEFRGPTALLIGCLDAPVCLAAAEVMQNFAKEVSGNSFVKMTQVGDILRQLPLPRQSDTDQASRLFVP